MVFPAHPQALDTDWGGLRQQVLASVEAHQEHLITFLQALIQARSVTGQEGAAAAVCAAKLRELSLDVDEWEIDGAQLRSHPAANPSRFSYAGRPNVVGRYNGATGGGGRSLLLNGHVDVVSPEPLAAWTRDPWSGEVKGNRLYGRGAMDMKGGIACMIIALESVLAAGIRPAGAVLVECVIEEEEGVGNGTLGSLLRGYTADACIVTEGTHLQVQPAMRGALRWKITVPGAAAHGTEKWKGADAIEKGIFIWQALRHFEGAMSAIHTHPLYAGYPISIPVAPDIFQAGLWRGMVPPECVIEGYLETLPGQRTAYWEDALRAYLRQVAASDPWLCSHPPRLDVTERYEAYEESLTNPFVAMMQRIAVDVTGTTATLSGLNGGCDAYIRHVYGNSPTVIFGPSGGGAHGADEYVDVDQLRDATRAIALAIVQWCGVV